MSQYLANSLFDAIGNATSFSITTVYLQLHIGDPGGAGTANAAGETTRQSVSFAAAASGLMSSDATVTWTAVSTAETYSHYSAWDASTAGNFLWSDTLVSNVTVAVNDDFEIPTGDVDLAFNLAA
jgi:hypothetical protein